MAFLICQLGGGNHIDYEMPVKPVTIGRSSQADLQIADERISRIHCGIRPEGDTFVVKDLGSTNGTWVNDERIQETRLRFGDTIRVGHSLLLFEARPRQQATSKLPDILEVELPARPFADSMQQLANEASRAPGNPRISPPAQ